MSFQKHDLLSAFIGVNEGYLDTEAKRLGAHVSSPNEAVKIVRRLFAKMGYVNEIESYPAYAIYPMEYGAPLGGEAVAAVFCDSKCGVEIKDFEELQKTLKQTSIALVASPRDDWLSTEGFVLNIGDCFSLKSAAQAWQIEAQKQKDAGGSFICGAVFEMNGEIYAKAETNPDSRSSNYVADVNAWKKAVITLFTRLGVQRPPSFNEKGFLYLRI